MSANTPPVFRFAPSPNGALHTGHAFSALLNQKMAQETKGRLLLRMEDIDQTRCHPELEQQMLEDLTWLGFRWNGTIMRQSLRFPVYQKALNRLQQMGLIYPSYMTRGQIRAFVSQNPSWPRDPDGTPLYPGKERTWPESRRRKEQTDNPIHALRLDMRKALDQIRSPLTWQESGSGPDGETGLCTAVAEAWGDVILARSDAPASYHLCVVTDDAAQNITHIVRGQDLFHATSVHRLLQTLLGLPAPDYHHHRLILDEDGRKLSKSDGDTTLHALREAGKTPQDIRAVTGF